MKTLSSVPLWLVIIALAGLLALLVYAGPLLGTLLIAALLAYLLDPLVRQLQQRFGVGRPLAAALVYMLAVLLPLGLVTALGAALWEQLPSLSLELRQALTEMERWLEQPLVLAGFQFRPQVWVESLKRAAANGLTTLPIGSGSILATVTENLLWGLVVLVSLYYFLKDGPQIKPWLVDLLPAGYQAEGQRLLDEIDVLWGVFLRMQVLIFFILGVLFLSSTLLIIWLFRNGWLPLSPIGLAILFLLVYTAIQQVDNLWLRPQLLGRTLKLHPGVVFVSLIAALALSGVLAAIIVVPALATLKLAGRYVHARLLGLPPWPAPAAVDETEQVEGSEDEVPVGEKAFGPQ
ncbi:MAG TPA: AI-2E family transporter [Anaerolineae bacterium]